MTGELDHSVQGHWDHLRVHVSIYKACSLWTVLVAMLVDAPLSTLLQLASGPQALLPPDSNQFLSALTPTAFQQQHTALHRSCSACLTDTATWQASQEASRSPYQLPQSQLLTHKEKTEGDRNEDARAKAGGAWATEGERGQGAGARRGLQMGVHLTFMSLLYLPPSPPKADLLPPFWNVAIIQNTSKL